MPTAMLKIEALAVYRHVPHILARVGNVQNIAASSIAETAAQAKVIEVQVVSKAHIAITQTKPSKLSSGTAKGRISSCVEAV